MKYLGIHKLIWFILVLLSVIYDLCFVFITALIKFLWDFRFRFNYYWNEYHEDFELDYDPKTEMFKEIKLPPRSVKEIFISRLNYWKNENKI